MAKYLVVHPKLNVLGKDGMKALVKGEQITLDEAVAKSLVASGKVELVVAKKPAPKPKAKPKAKAKPKTKAK